MLSLVKPHHICCISISSILYPLTIFLNKLCNNIKTMEFMEKGCGILNLSLLVTSELFWGYPIRHGFYHKVDGVVAKATFVYFLLYTLQKNNLSQRQRLEYYFITLSFLTTFYVSNYLSSRSWCSIPHLLVHAILHLLTSRGMTFAYI